MPATALPTLAETTVVRASPALLAARHAAARSASRLDPATYDAWTAELEHAPHSAAGRATVWALVGRDDLGGAAYAYAQTRRVDAFAKGASGTPDSSSVRDSCVHVLTGVLTPAAYRRNGYATHLLRCLHHVLAPDLGGAPAAGLPHVDPPAAASLLISIASTGFYERATIDAARPGWLTRSGPENNALSFALDLAVDADPAAAWDADVIYAPELNALAPALARRARRNLERAAVARGETLVVPDPSSPGALAYAEPHARLHANFFGRGTVDGALPVGVRLRAPGTGVAGESDGADDDDGRLGAVVLFVPQCFVPTQLAITLISGLQPSALPALLAALRDIGARTTPACTSAAAWGVDAADPAVAALVRAGAALDDRAAPGAMLPLGVAGYGPAGSTTRLLGAEMWVL